MSQDTAEPVELTFECTGTVNFAKLSPNSRYVAINSNEHLVVLNVETKNVIIYLDPVNLAEWNQDNVLIAYMSDKSLMFLLMNEPNYIYMTLNDCVAIFLHENTTYLATSTGLFVNKNLHKVGNVSNIATYKNKIIYTIENAVYEYSNENNKKFIFRIDEKIEKLVANDEYIVVVTNHAVNPFNPQDTDNVKFMYAYRNNSVYCITHYGEIKDIKLDKAVVTTLMLGNYHYIVKYDLSIVYAREAKLSQGFAFPNSINLSSGHLVYQENNKIMLSKQEYVYDSYDDAVACDKIKDAFNEFLICEPYKNKEILTVDKLFELLESTITVVTDGLKKIEIKENYPDVQIQQLQNYLTEQYLNLKSLKNTEDIANEITRIETRPQGETKVEYKLIYDGITNIDNFVRRFGYI